MALPKTLQASIPDSLFADASQWWNDLSEADRQELTQLCDARREIFLFETLKAHEQNDEDSDKPLKIRGSYFLPRDDASDGTTDGSDDYFDHLVSNPELMIVHDPTRRTFRIGCSQRHRARRCFELGRMPADFQCPFANDRCLMNAIRNAAADPHVTLSLRRI